MEIQSSLVSEGWQFLLPVLDGDTCKKHQTYRSLSSYKTENRIGKKKRSDTEETLLHQMQGQIEEKHNQNRIITFNRN